MPLLNTADAVYLGATPADAVYLGAEKVWPSGFDPAALAGLTIWLDASQFGLADGAYVDSWPDLSTGKASTNISTAPNRPVLRAGGLNGKSVVRFAPGNGLRWVPGGLSGEAGLNWTCVHVSRMWGAVIGRVVSAGYPPANFALGYHGGFEDKAYMEGWTYPDVSRPQTADWHLYTCAEEGVIGLVKAWFYRNGVFLSGDACGHRRVERQHVQPERV